MPSDKAEEAKKIFKEALAKQEAEVKAKNYCVMGEAAAESAEMKGERKWN